MHNRKNGKLKKIVALAVNLQLFLTTSAFSQERTGNGINKAVNVISDVANATMQGMQQAQQQQMQMYTANMVRGSMAMQFVNPAQTPPMLIEAGCLVLDAKPALPADKCESLDPQKATSGYYAAVVEAAENNINDIDNLLTSGHEQFTTQGIGCFNKALKAFTAKLNQRLEAVNKLQEDIERRFEAFDAISKQTVEGVKNLNAELTGKPAQRAKDKKWDKEFSDPQCASFLNSEEFKTQGRKGGYEGIKTLLSGPNAQSAVKLKGEQRAIQREVKQIAKAISTHVQKKKSIASVDPSAIGIRSKFITTKNAGLLSIVNNSAANAQSELDDLQKEAFKSIETNDTTAQEIVNGIVTDTVDLDNALFDYERKNKNDCLNNYLNSNFGGSQGLTAKLQDPNISKKANEEADSAFKNTIASILSDNEYTMEEKIKLIAQEEKKSGNQRYSFTTGKSINIKGTQIGASTRLRATDMLNILADNCSERFESLKNQKGKSPREVINQIKGFNNKFQKIQSEYSTKLANNIISGMLECSDDKTTGKAPSSCSKDSLNTQGENFCLRTANLCASNMLACKDKAEKIYDSKRNAQLQLAKTYNTQMQAMKATLLRDFQVANKTLELNSRTLDGMYQMGTVYNTPVGLDLNMLQDKFIASSDIDPSLMMEDPAAYKKIMLDNIKKLKESIKKSNEEILNGAKNDEDTVIASNAGDATKYKGVSGEIKKYIDNYENQKGAYEAYAQNCRARIAEYDNQVNSQNEQIAEENAQRRSLCNSIMALRENPAGFCGEASDLGDEVLKIAAVAGDRSAAANLKAFGASCDSFNNEDGSNMYDVTSSSTGGAIKTPTPKEYCENKKSKDISACKPLLSNDYKLCSEKGINDKDKRLIKISTQWCYKEDDPATKSYSFKEKNDDKCDSGYKPISNKEHIDALGEKKLTSSDLESFCYLDEELEKDKKYSDAVKYVQGLIVQEQRSKMYSDIGNISISQCGSIYGGEVGKELLDMGGQMLGRELAGSNALGM